MKKIMLGVMALSLVFVAVETSAKSFSSRSSSFRSSSSFKSSYKSSSPSYSYKSSSSSSTSKPRTSVSESNSGSYAQKNLSTNSYTPVDSYQRKTIPVPAPASKPGLSTGQKVGIGAAAVGTGVVAHEAIAEHADSANHIAQPGIPHDNTTTNTSNRNNYSGSSNNSGHYTTYSQPVRTPRPAVRNSNSWMHYYLFRSIQRPARPYYAYNSHYAYRMSYLSLNDWERTRNATRNYVSQFDSVQTFEKKAKAQCTGEVYLCDVMDNADFIYDAAFYRGFSEALGPKAAKYGIPDLHASVYNTYMRDFNGHKYMLNQIPDNIKGDEVLASLIKQAYFTGYSVGLYTAKNRL